MGKEKDKLRINWNDKGKVLEASWRIGVAIGFHKVPDNLIKELKKDGKKECRDAIELKICETAFNELAVGLPMEFKGLKLRTHRGIPEGYLYVSQYDLQDFLRDSDVKMPLLKVKREERRN